MFNFSFHLSFRFVALGFLYYDLDCIFFKTTGEFYFWFFLVRSLDFEFLNSQIFDFLEFFRIRILSRCSFIFFEFRIIFSTSFYGIYEGNSSFFYLFFIKIYKNALFSEQNPIAVNWKIIWLLRWVWPPGTPKSSKPKLGTRKGTKREKSCVKRDIFLRRKIFPKIESETRLETIRAVFFPLHHSAREADSFLTLTLDDDIFLIDEIFRIKKIFSEYQSFFEYKNKFFICNDLNLDFLISV